MVKSTNIASIGFRPPVDVRLTVEVMSIAELRKRAPAEHFLKLQRADFYRLMGVESGRSAPMVDFSTYPAQRLDWLLIRPGQVMRYDFSTEWTGWLLVFRPDGLFSQGRNYQTDEARLMRHVDDLTCQHSLNRDQHGWMDHSLRQMQHDGELTADVSLRNEILRLQLAGMLLRLSIWQEARTAPVQTNVSKATDFKRFQQRIEADFSQHHDVRHYADALGMSEKSLGRLCLAATGVSAKAWITQRLCLEAKRLLAHTSMTAQTIGAELGYEDASNFVKFFRRETGLTPLAFRRTNTLSKD